MKEGSFQRTIKKGIDTIDKNKNNLMAPLSINIKVKIYQKISKKEEKKYFISKNFQS